MSAEPWGICQITLGFPPVTWNRFWTSFPFRESESNEVFPKWLFWGSSPYNSSSSELVLGSSVMLRSAKKFPQFRQLSASTPTIKGLLVQLEQPLLSWRKRTNYFWRESHLASAQRSPPRRLETISSMITWTLELYSWCIHRSSTTTANPRTQMFWVTTTRCRDSGSQTHR